MTALQPLIFMTVLATSGATAVTPLTTASTAVAPPSVIDVIDARYQSGEIDLATRHRLRVLAVRQPAALPRDLQPYLGQPLPAGTRYLVEAIQYVLKSGAIGSPLHDLLQPPDDLDYVVESVIWPIRVSYADPAQQAYAETVRDYAELSFTVQINDFGFYQPPMEPGYEPYRFYIAETGEGVAGYTAPYDENPDTQWIDCFTYIVINPNLGDRVGSTVAHESNHAMQAAMDCLETTTYWENTAVYIEAETAPEFADEILWFIPSFQSQPWRALDYFQQGSGYQYGGVLWNLYLVDKIAPADGPVFVRQVWEASIQSFWNNEPDYFDAISEVATARGADASTMEALYTDFAEARYFVSSNDDGEHITGAGEYWDAEPAVVAQHQGWELPVLNRQPPDNWRPAPYGSNHVLLTLPPEYTRPIEVRFDGANETRWGVRAVLTGGDQPTQSVDLPLDDGSWAGSARVDPTGHAALLLVVANLGRANYDPDDDIYPTAEYSYSFIPVVDPPQITGLYPAAVVRGQQNLHLRLSGQNFVFGPEFEIRFTDPLLQVTSVDRVSDSEVLFTLTVPASANLGSHHVTVVNAGGSQTTVEGLLAVVDEIGPPDPGAKTAGCSTGAGAPLPWILVLGVLGWWWRRRHHCR